MMNNEEFDRKVEFLLNQQARFDAGMQELREGQKELQEAQKETDEKLKHMFDGFEEAKQLTTQTREDLAELTSLTTEGFKILYEQSRNTDAKIAALVKAQIETEEQQRKTDEQLRITDAQIQETAAQLRITQAQVQETSAQIKITDAIVRNIGVKFDRHLKEDHNSG